MAEPETAPPPAPKSVAAGIPVKMVIIIVAGTLALGIGGAFVMFKLVGGESGGEGQKAEATVAF